MFLTLSLFAHRKHAAMWQVSKTTVHKFVPEYQIFTPPCALIRTNGAQNKRTLIEFHAFTQEARLPQRKQLQRRPQSLQCTAAAEVCTSMAHGNFQRTARNAEDPCLTEIATTKTTKLIILTRWSIAPAMAPGSAARTKYLAALQRVRGVVSIRSRCGQAQSADPRTIAWQKAKVGFER